MRVDASYRFLSSSSSFLPFLISLIQKSISINALSVYSDGIDSLLFLFFPSPEKDGKGLDKSQ